MKPRLPSTPWTEAGPLTSLSADQRSFVRLLQLSLRTRMDLVAMTRALAAERRNSYGARLMQFAASVSVGTPIANAIEQVPGLLDADTVLSIRVASETGTLAETYESLLRDSIDEGHHFFDRVRHISLGRTVLVVSMTIFVYAFQSNFIWPTFRKIQEEFTVSRRPNLLRWLMDWNGVIVATLLVALLVCVFLFFWRWYSRMQPRFRRRVSRSHVLGLIANVIGSGRPAEAAIATLARFHPHPKARRALLDVFEATQRGDDIWHALSNRHYLSPNDADALQIASSADAKAWLLNRSARRRCDHARWSMQWITQTASLAVLLLVAVTVAATSIATFQFLSDIIEGLA